MYYVTGRKHVTCPRTCTIKEYYYKASFQGNASIGSQWVVGVHQHVLLLVLFFTNKNCYSEASAFIHVLHGPVALLDPWLAMCTKKFKLSESINSCFRWLLLTFSNTRI